MRLQVKEAALSHSDIVTGVAWTPANELWTCSDDQAIWRCAAEGEAPTKVCTLDTFCTALHWYPSASRKQQPGAGTDVFLLACVDGSFRLMRANGREEKRVDAHAGPVTAVRWNSEGTAVATGGEDGAVKVWSRSGMLRSVLAQTECTVYCVAWSPECDAIVYGRGGSLVVQPVAAGGKAVQWKAHEGAVLAVDWSAANGRIVSGGEDGRYKVWDAHGRLLHQSGLLPSSCTALAWAPRGDLLAVGTRGHVLLCSGSGGVHSQSPVGSGCIRSVAWSCDGARVAVSGEGGLLAVGHVVQRSAEWGRFSAHLEAGNRVTLQEVGSGVLEELEVREQVTALSFAYDHLIAATPTQVCIYSPPSWSSPAVVAGVDTPMLVVQAEQLFLLVDPSTGLQTYTYQGRPLANPKWQGLRPESLTAATCSLSNDCLAVVDRTDPRCVRIVSPTTGQPLSDPLRHTQPVNTVALSQAGGPADRRLALLDSNKDLHCTALQSGGLARLGGLVDAVTWHANADLLVGLTAGRLLLWADPGVLAADKALLEATKSSIDVSQHGPGLELMSFSGSVVTLRAAHGALVRVRVSVYPLLLAQAAATGRWEAATRLCRHVDDQGLWAALASRALAARETSTAEAAYAALGQVAVVSALARMRCLPREEARAAELALLRRRPEEAEAILVQAGLLYRALKMHVRAKNWDRALELAVKHKSHVDTVLWYRAQELAGSGQQETRPRFLQFAQQVEVVEEQIRAKISLEKEHEKQGAGGAGGKRR